MTRTRPANIAVAIALIATLLVAADNTSPTPAGATADGPVVATCGGPSTRYLRGTIEGEDGRWVNTQVHIYLFDSSGTRLDVNALGCDNTFGAATILLNINQNLPAEGSTSGAGATKVWRLNNLPSVVAEARMEVYPKGDPFSPPPDTLIRYGKTLRQTLVPPDGYVPIRLPLGCGLSENGVTGTTGTFDGQVLIDGKTPDTVGASAFSISPDIDDVISGWGSGADLGGGFFEIRRLAADQDYRVFLNATLGGTVWNDDRWFQPIDPCVSTPMDWIIGKFQDVAPSHPFFDEIYWMLNQNLTQGYGDDSYRPAVVVTRQAIAAWFHRLQGSPPGPFPDPVFSDVLAGHPFDTEIWWMVDSGRSTGFVDGTYKPKKCVTRQAIAAFMYREAGSPPEPFPDPAFTDVAASHPFYAEIAWMAAQDYAAGWPDGTYRPTSCVTRQAAAAFLYRAYA